MKNYKIEVNKIKDNEITVVVKGKSVDTNIKFNDINTAFEFITKITGMVNVSCDKESKPIPFKFSEPSSVFPFKIAFESQRAKCHICDGKKIIDYGHGNVKACVCL